MSERIPLTSRHPDREPKSQLRRDVLPGRERHQVRAYDHWLLTKLRTFLPYQRSGKSNWPNNRAATRCFLRWEVALWHYELHFQDAMPQRDQACKCNPTSLRRPRNLSAFHTRDGSTDLEV